MERETEREDHSERSVEAEPPSGIRPSARARASRDIPLGLGLGLSVSLSALSSSFYLSLSPCPSLLPPLPFPGSASDFAPAFNFKGCLAGLRSFDVLDACLHSCTAHCYS